MKGVALPIGMTCSIVCKENGQALRVNAQSAKECLDARITSGAVTPADPLQLFLVYRVGTTEEDHEVVHFMSDFVLDEESKEVHLRKGKRRSDQLFFLCPVPGMDPNTYWFFCDSSKTEALQLEGILRIAPYDPNRLGQMFTLVFYERPPIEAQSCLIINAGSGKALDVPGSSLEAGERIVQYGRHRRVNQWWYWRKNAKGFQIVSLLTDLCLDVAGESKEPGSKVVQWTKTGGDNQLWTIEPMGAGTVRIRGVQSGLYLGIKNDSFEDGGKLEIQPAGGATSVWRIEGAMPM